VSVTELPKLYTDREAAVPLCCSPATVARLRKRRLLGYTRVGKKVFTTDAHIKEYLRSQECTATSTKDREALTGTSTSTMSELDNASALALARQIAQPQRKN
jgi:hypothetical protein